MKQPHNSNNMDRLKQIEQELTDCQSCYKDGYSQMEFGWGDTTPGKIMFIGQAPGRSNPNGLRGNSPWDKFFLDLIKPYLTPDDFYFTNLVKVPCTIGEVDERTVEHCADHVIDEIEAIKPMAVLALGKHAYNYLRKNPRFKGRLISVMHPSAIKYGTSREDWIAQFEKVLEKINYIR